MSVLEHGWIIIFEAGIASYNTVKIVGLKKYEDIHNKVSQ